MARDIESSYWPSTSSEPSARLCNFHTDRAGLLPSHQAWLQSNVVPLLRSGGTYLIEIGGLASRLGAAGHNMTLGQARADAVKNFLQLQLQSSLPNILTGSYGETVSGGGVNDNDGFYRAVLFKYHKGVTRLPEPPPPVKRNPTTKTSTRKMYFGLGAKFGGILLGGTQTIEGYLFSADDYNDQVYVEARVYTVGPGLGGGANAVLIIAFGSSNKSSFVGTKFDGWDFAVSLGGRWGDALKSASKIGAVGKIAAAVKSAGKLKPVIKGASKLSPSEWEKISELIKAGRDGLGVDSESKTPQINVFDIPLAGASVELSIYKWWGKITTFN